MASPANIGVATIDGKEYPSPGLGLMSIGSIYQQVSDEEARAVLEKALEVGATFWDSADIYGGGLSERRIGQFLKETGKRDQVYVASKFGVDWDRKTGDMLSKGRGDEAYVRQCVQETTERLGFVPDLYYQHRQDQSGTVEVEETWQTLVKLQNEGKLKALGVSEISPDTLRRILKVAKVSALQIEYSPFERDIETNGLLELCRENGITIVAYSPIGRGLAGGTFQSYEEVKNDLRANFPRFNEANFETNYALTKKLQEIADRKKATVAQLSIAWVSAQGKDIVPIPGTGKAKNVAENMAAAKVQLSDEDLKELRSIIDGHTTKGERYPDVMQKMLDKGMN